VFSWASLPSISHLETNWWVTKPLKQLGLKGTTLFLTFKKKLKPKKATQLQLKSRKISKSLSKQTKNRNGHNWERCKHSLRNMRPLCLTPIQRNPWVSQRCRKPWDNCHLKFSTTASRMSSKVFSSRCTKTIRPKNRVAN
jgi:hypothetical protein